MQSEIGTTAAAERTPNQEESTSLCSESHVNRAETPDALSIRDTPPSANVNASN